MSTKVKPPILGPKGETTDVRELNQWRDYEYNRLKLIFYGVGSPEGSIVAPIGSIYLRTNGGAGTTLYVKESGTGNVGWIGK